ncbi:HAD-IA family hydrolase [Candidatus Babeliales bacterium]|nr:HAD-IA family hydrolase [Candidatus Babeliales bacterium]
MNTTSHVTLLLLLFNLSAIACQANKETILDKTEIAKETAEVFEEFFKSLESEDCKTMKETKSTLMSIQELIDAAASFKQKNIVFDMTGVLFEIHTSKLLYIQKIGILRLLGYALWHLRSPFDIIPIMLDFLDKMSPPTNNKYYKGRILPELIYKWQIGKKTSEQIKADVQKTIKTHPEYFSSDLEGSIISIAVDTIFSPEHFADSCQETDLIPLVHFLRKQKNTDGTPKYNLYLFSNFDAESFELLKKQHPQLFACFDGLVISGSAGFMKPDREIFDYLFTTYKLDPHECLLIDDQEENVEAGLKLGMQTIRLLGSH